MLHRQITCLAERNPNADNESVLKLADVDKYTVVVVETLNLNSPVQTDTLGSTRLLSAHIYDVEPPEFGIVGNVLDVVLTHTRP